MKAPLVLAALAALLVAVPCIDARAAQGDVYVPAHRTRDGTLVPPNVPPSSGGTRIASSLGHVAPGRSTTRSFRNAIVAPIFVQAKTLVR
jgi:hypothetical protein